MFGAPLLSGGGCIGAPLVLGDFKYIGTCSLRNRKKQEFEMLRAIYGNGKKRGEGQRNFERISRTVHEGLELEREDGEKT